MSVEQLIPCPMCLRHVGHNPECPIDYSALTLPDDYEKPDVTLVGADGNAFAIMFRVDRALTVAFRAAGWNHTQSRSYRDRVRDAMMAGDYGNLLRVAMDVIEPRALVLED